MDRPALGHGPRGPRAGGHGAAALRSATSPTPRTTTACNAAGPTAHRRPQPGQRAGRALELQRATRSVEDYVDPGRPGRRTGRPGRRDGPGRVGRGPDGGRGAPARQGRPAGVAGHADTGADRALPSLACRSRGGERDLPVSAARGEGRLRRCARGRRPKSAPTATGPSRKPSGCCARRRRRSTAASKWPPPMSASRRLLAEADADSFEHRRQQYQRYRAREPELPGRHLVGRDGQAVHATEGVRPARLAGPSHRGQTGWTSRRFRRCRQRSDCPEKSHTICRITLPCTSVSRSLRPRWG